MNAKQAKKQNRQQVKKNFCKYPLVQVFIPQYWIAEGLSV